MQFTPQLPDLSHPSGMASVSEIGAATEEALVHSASRLATPALVIQAAVVRRNISRLAEYAKRHGLLVRPHTKTHKSQMMARLQLEAGAVGLTVAKVGEAEQMRPTGDDLLMAYPAVDSARCERLAEIARNGTLRVAVDSRQAVDALATSACGANSLIGLLVEMDVGLGRTGVGTPEETLKLAQYISGIRGVRLDGILCYPGHIWAAADEQEPFLSTVSSRLRAAQALWSEHGLEAKIISGGSTPTAYQSHLVQGLTEIRPGTYIFNDMNTFRAGFCELSDCAAHIVCTVISDAVKDQVVIDAGTKTLTSDLCIPARESGHGFIMEYPEAKITRLSEEHGQVDVSLCTKRPKIGERLSIIPNHICPCVNLRDVFWWCEPDGAAVSVKINARGMLS